jgi:mannan endo-1,4-beta-mannosidase
MSGGDACKKLYKLIYDRFVKTHGLNNLIWTWTSYAGDKENWYPGDDMVDMIVCDYENKNTWSNFKKFFGDSGKMLGLGEEGKLPDPAEFAKRPWLYFMTWAYMIEDPKKGNTKEWIKAVYSDPRVLTLDDVAKLRGVKK